MIQQFLGFSLTFSGAGYVQFAFASAVYFYGGWPFLSGFLDEAQARRPGMMTLIALAVSVAYFFSSAVVFGFPGHQLFWELATLIAIMLLGHWIEMRSVMGASRALEKLVRLMPSEAHRLRDDGTTEDVPVSELSFGVMLSHAMGAVLMSASTVIVALNAQLLWRASAVLKTK